jgi:hypothetical protein
VTILDSQGHEVKVMPEWHRDIQTGALIQWCGHWFTFEGIDPDHDPNVVIIKYKEPTGKTKRRNNAARN